MSDRLDIALVKQGLLPSREKAKAAIVSGAVYVNGSAATKPSTPVEKDDVVEVRGETLRYVGRGGLKLQKALASFALDLAGRTCVDLGASTGGFTDCMLQAGATRVVAVDVGHGQLAAALAADPRVENREGTDARTVTPELLGGTVDFAATDVSFISLAHVLPSIAAVLRPGGKAVCLIKPQFEAGRELVGKHGVVKDPRVHRAVIERVLEQARTAGLAVRGLDFSPIKGPEGNIEYLLYAAKPDDASAGDPEPAGTAEDFAAAPAPDVAAIVEGARAALGAR